MCWVGVRDHGGLGDDCGSGGGGVRPMRLKGVPARHCGMAHLCHAAEFDDGGIATIVASWFGRGVVMEERVGDRQQATPQAPEQAKMALHGRVLCFFTIL